MCAPEPKLFLSRNSTGSASCMYVTGVDDTDTSESAALTVFGGGVELGRSGASSACSRWRAAAFCVWRCRTVSRMLSLRVELPGPNSNTQQLLAISYTYEGLG